MNTVVVWLLVGFVSGNGRTSDPPPAHFSTESSCQQVKLAIEDIATASKLRCVAATIVVTGK